MKEILIFIGGLFVGEIVGVVIMCLLQINRLNDIENREQIIE